MACELGAADANEPAALGRHAPLPTTLSIAYPIRYVRSGSRAIWPPRHARTNILSRRQHVCVLELAGLLADLPHMHAISEPLDLAWFVIPSRRCEPRGLSRSRPDADPEGSPRRQPGGLTW